MTKNFILNKFYNDEYYAGEVDWTGSQAPACKLALAGTPAQPC